MKARFWSLRSDVGGVGYEEARALQLALVELRARDLIPDTVLFLEHEPVITRGRGLQFTGAERPRHMPAPAMLPPGIAFAESERGGDLTYHGPGQLVIYPICRLDGRGFGPNHDVAGFLRKFEQAIIRVIGGESRDAATGVWIGDRKVASMGIAVRRWVTYHGLAINCVNDLKPFHLISPCGFSPEVMTRVLDTLEAGSPEAVELADWTGRGRGKMEKRIAEAFSEYGTVVERLTIGEAMERAVRLGAEVSARALA
jgi:lipoyl(octanoyl) transferase